MAVARRDYSDNNLAVAFAGLPERSRDQLSCIHSVQLKKLRRWVEQLNILNLGQAVPSLCNVLTELAELDLGVEDVFDLYITLRPTIVRVQESAANVYHQKRLQLTIEARQALEFAHRLDVATVNVLKVLLADLAQVRIGSRVKQMTALVGAHAFIHFGEICFRLNEFCLSIPKGFWRECHSVYWFLREAGCHNFEHEQIEIQRYPRILNAEKIYKALILYTIIGPSRYDRTLQPSLFGFILELAQLVEFTSTFDSADFYGVMLTEDLSHATSKSLAEASPESVLYINAQALEKRLRDAVRLNTPLSENSMLNMLVPEFLHSITSEQYRQQPREPIAVEVESYFGLLQIHRLLSAANTTTKSSVGEEIDYGASVSRAIKSEVLYMKDQSLGGFCLETKSKYKMLYEPGDLVFFYQDSRPILNVIRWKRMKSTGENLIGLECLGSAIEAIDFAVKDQDMIGDFEEGIFYRLDGVQILLSRVALVEGQELCVQNLNKRLDYRVAGVHWLVSGYVQSLVEPLG